MNDEEYRQARDAIEQPRCQFEQALRTGKFICQHSHRMALGERESIRCFSAKSNVVCQQFFAQCLHHSGFALGKAHLPKHLPFSQVMKVQIGGLQAVSIDYEQEMGSLIDISALLQNLQAKQAGFEGLDYSRIVPFMAKFSVRASKIKK